MAERNEERNRGEREPSGSNEGGQSTRSSMPGVNFDEMNFEQRRAPYNSGKRNVGDRQYDESRIENTSNPKRNKH